MGQAKVKHSKRYEIAIDAAPRYALYTAFLNEKNVKEREDRRAFADAWEALDFGDYVEIKRESPKNNTDVEKYRIEEDFDRKLNKMGGCWIVGIETVRTALTVIDRAFKSGVLYGIAAQRLNSVENLFEECQRGDHIYSEDIEVSDNDSSDSVNALSLVEK